MKQSGGVRVVQLVMLIMVMTCLIEESKAKFCTSTYISALVQLIPCRPALSLFRPFPPTEVCCNALKNLGQPCLCALLSSPPVSGVDLNLALMLPQKCNANFDPCL